MKQLFSILLACLLLASEVSADVLESVSPQQLLAMQQHKKALVVDIRTEAEWQSSGVIPNSHKLQSFDQQGNFDEDKWLSALEKMKSSPDQAVILVCRSGNRSSKIGALLSDKLGMKNIYHLDNGLQSWVKTGHTLSPNCLQVACK